MVKGKTKTPLKFTWSRNVGRDMVCSVGRYTLSVYRNRHNFWLWSVYDGSKILRQGRAIGYRRRHTAQRMAEGTFGTPVNRQVQHG
jgi:hypothetical protein